MANASARPEFLSSFFQQTGFDDEPVRKLAKGLPEDLVAWVHRRFGGR